ncbi:DNA-3-methyladenine glycosylase I [Dyella japonica]|uniref:3-methyladenine DNA glycosylase n=1 Tax=Dyella japonica A8 TaxID=1217721 RepID=A0A075JW66_9GAMM|nr:DNA-3-methyladenine glycosylase I [Dyella japonica]AIF46114.1 3-methyladenine DNA glycosylase [Dyella japonica A8]
MNSYVAPDGAPRCSWAGSAPDFLAYHDTEWGFPVADDRRLFEKISLEGFQSGLSWRTILAKRPAFRAAFADFDFRAIAEFDENEVDRLLADTGIVRHRGKIQAVINNARCAVEMEQREGSLAAFFWSYEPGPAETAIPQTASISPSSLTLSKELKRRGWKFVGPTTAFAFMQAMGLINDHTTSCCTRPLVAAARTQFEAPRRR